MDGRDDGSIEATVREVIVDDIGWTGSPALLSPDYDLIDGDVLDSLAIFQLVSLIEDRFGFEVPDAELVPENFTTIRAISRLVGRSTSTGT